MSRAALTRRIQTARARAESRSRQVSTVLVVLAVILGGMAFWFAREAAALRGGVSAQNTALTDAIQTSELKGKVTDDVNTLFSYDYTDPTKADDAARSALTGKAVQQYDSLIAAVRQQGPSQKLVVTTTVTSSAVEILDGARARVLIFADQEDTRATTKDTTYAAAMLAVDVVRQGGSWRIANFDTLTG
jgi:Mce-associated membrane protein